MQTIKEITDTLREMVRAPEGSSISQDQRQMLHQASSRQIARALQNLLDAGVSVGLLWRAWERNHSALPDQINKLRAELPHNHILRRVLAEHEITLCFMADLDDANEEIRKLESASSMTMEIRKLANIVGQLAAMSQHRDREEEVIFPQLRLYGYSTVLDIIKDQHDYVYRKRDELKRLVWKIDTIPFQQFKSRLEQIVTQLVPASRMHIFVEGNIICPLALEVISDNRVWSRMKDIADEIGYCSYDSF